MGNNERLLYPDILRVAATVAVVMLHICAGIMSSNGPGLYYNMALALNGLCRFSVPVFVMVSGMNILDGKRSLSPAYLGKKILRLAAAFVFWSAVYMLITWAYNREAYPTLADALRTFAYGHYHMWFLYMLAGMYLIAPFLARISESDRLCKYFFLLWLIFGSVIPLLFSVFPALSQNLSPVLDKMQLRFPLGYSAYFILGRWLSRKDFSRRGRAIIYVSGIMGAALTCVFSLLSTESAGGLNDGFLSFFSPFAAAYSMALFVFARQLCSKEGKVKTAAKGAALLSSATFGVYLCHPLFNLIFEHQGLTAAVFHPLLAPFVLTILVGLCSFALAFVLHRIPLIGKYIC